MNRYIPKQTLSVPAGTVLYFNDKQAGDRGARIERLDKGKYRAREALQVKVGEEFGMDGELPKGQATLVSPVAGAVRRAADLLAGTKG